MKHPIFRSLCVLLLLSLLFVGQGAQPVSAAVYDVNTLDDTIVDDNLCSLREAIHAANNNFVNDDCGSISNADDQITFSVAGTIALINSLPPIMGSVGKLTIDGGGQIIISGDQDNNNTPDHQIFYVNPGAYLYLMNLTLIRGIGVAGGAVVNQGELVVNNTTFSAHQSTGNGGAISNLSGSMAGIYNSVFSNNSAISSGGAISNSGLMVVELSRFNGNSASVEGGAIDNNNILTVDRSTFVSNIASSNGGAIKSSNASGKLTLAESTLNSNIALGWGGGIYAPNGELTVYNSTLANNSAAVQGGGILSAATTIVANTTLSGNSAGAVNGGGGVRVLGGSTTLKNTIIANSINGDCVGTLASAKNNLISTETNACGLTNGVDGNIIGFDPDLGTLTGSPAYFPLNPGSLAIDAGDNATCADANLADNRSQNGVTRPQDGDGDNTATCDIGAYERTLQPQTYLVDTLNDNTTDDEFCTLREAILAANDAPANKDCGVGGGGDDLIQFSVSGIIRLGTTLPNIVSGQGKLTIDGAGDIHINGDTGGDNTGDVRVFWVNAGAHLILEKLTVEFGEARPNDGGGVANFGTLEIRQAIFHRNYAAGGGAVANFNGATLIIDRSTLSSNFATNGGGGVANYAGGTTTVINSTLYDNHGGYGGGLWNGGTMTVLNSTLRANRADNSSQGGGLYVFAGGNTTLKNTIIANSINGDCVGTLASAKNNLISTETNACGLMNGVDGNIIGFDPDLGTLTGSPAYFPLNPGSLAIDAGDNAICAAAPVSNQSQNGITRPKDYDGNGSIVCDIGAFEAPQSVFKIFLPLILRSP